MGQAKPVGGRWLYESDGLKAAWLDVAHCQVANGETLARLAAEVAEAEAAEVAPWDPAAAAGREEPFWLDYGRWDPAGYLSDEELWEHTARIAAGMVGVDLTPRQMDELLYQLHEAGYSVAAGARWDEANWNRASCRGLLDDLSIEGGCPAAAEELAQLLKAGRVPGDLVEEVRAAVAGLAAAGG